MFRDHRPFHSHRLWSPLASSLDDYGLVRSKGFLLASRPDVHALWSQAGTSGRCDPVGVPVAVSGEGPGERAELLASGRV